MFAVTHRLCILGSCAAHEELKSPAPAAGLAFLKPVSNGEKKSTGGMCMPECCVLCQDKIREED